MPLWTIYHSVQVFSDKDKAALAEKIADIYTPFMPRFYVAVVFQAIDSNNFYIGGKSNDRYVRMTMEHIAREFVDEAASRRFIDKVNKELVPFVRDKGYDWEFHIDETRFEHWSVNGFYPPREGTIDEERWRNENRPSPRTHD